MSARKTRSPREVLGLARPGLSGGFESENLILVDVGNGELVGGDWMLDINDTAGGDSNLDGALEKAVDQQRRFAEVDLSPRRCSVEIVEVVG